MLILRTEWIKLNWLNELMKLLCFSKAAGTLVDASVARQQFTGAPQNSCSSTEKFQRHQKKTHVTESFVNQAYMYRSGGRTKRRLSCWRSREHFAFKYKWPTNCQHCIFTKKLTPSLMNKLFMCFARSLDFLEWFFFCIKQI